MMLKGLQLQACGLLFSLFMCLVAGDVFAKNRHIDIIVDTSGSMDSSDRQRYTLQVSKIIADLLGKQDTLSVIRLPQHEASCTDKADFSLAQKFDSGDRGGFHKKTDKLLEYDTGNYFAAPIYTAKADLEKHHEQSRLLLFLADSGGLGSCNDELNKELADLKAQGVMIAAINLGGLGAFNGNPAFSFTVSAQDAEAMVKAVAEVYQKFIGSKQIQTGTVSNSIDIDINPMTNEAFLVVAADGLMTDIEGVASNPTAQHMELNYLGGGQTVGIDQKRRDYRIVRLQRPATGHWQFKVQGLTASAGWMLLQDSALGLRLLSSSKQVLGVNSLVEAELYDLSTGKRVSDKDGLPEVDVTMTVEGKNIGLHDDGLAGDKQAGDGIYSADYVFGQLGGQRIPIKINNPFLDRQTEIDIHVDKVKWLLQPHIPQQTEVAVPIPLTVKAQPTDNSQSAPPINTIEVSADGKQIATLTDNGKNGDKIAHDNIFTALWTPEAIADYTLSLSPRGGGEVQGLDNIGLKVVGSIKLGKAIPTNLGTTHSNQTLIGQLDLSNAVVKGEFPLTINSNYMQLGSVLEIDLGQGWQTLASAPLAVTLSENGPKTWPLRLRVGDCPSAVTADSSFTIQITGLSANNQPLSLPVPLSVIVIEDAWLHCWWPILAMIFAALSIIFIFYGFWSPSRFSTRLGIVLSPEEDMGEGFFHPIKAVQGTGSGFYRDAHAYICPDFRLSGKAKGALAVLRPSDKRVYLKPINGMAVYRQNIEGEWEKLPHEETLIHFGVVFKNALGTLFFELRNK